MNKYWLIFLFLSLPITFLSAQTIDQEQYAREELKRRGLEEDEVMKKLEERGFDVNNLDPSDLPSLERELEEIAKELEDEKEESTLKEKGEEIVEKGSKELAKNSGEDIQRAVDQGATIEEAIAAEVLEEQNEDLPPARTYGQHLYRENAIRLFSESYDIKPTDEYVLGAGDIVSVDIWGISEESGTFEITKEGYIKPTKMPRINLKGVTYEKAKELVRKRFSSYYNFRPEEFELTISYSRTMKVNIVGEVLKQGAYTLSAVNTAVNALAAAGGPSDIGTVRNVQIIGSSGLRKSLDLYEYLLDPSIAKEYYLSENDYIFIEVAKKIVSIQGAVNRPFRYELKDGEQLGDLIRFAGGLQNQAYKGNLQIIRFENDKEVIIDVNWADLAKRGLDYPLEAGDAVIVKDIPAPFQNFAQISGAVELPTKYEISGTTKITDLINKAVLKPDAKTNIAFLLRTNPDQTIRTLRVDLDAALSAPNSEANYLIKPKDKLIVLSSSRFTDAQVVTVEGAVRQPIEHPYNAGQNLRISDAINLSHGLSRDAADFAYIQRPTAGNSLKKEYIRVAVKDAVDNPGSSADITLLPGDMLKVASALTFTDETFVKVTGSVRQPGDYAYDESLKLSDVLSLAGGLKLEASRSRIDVSRLQFNEDQSTETQLITVEVDENFQPVAGGDFQLEAFDQIYVRSAPEFEIQRNVRVDGEVTYPGSHPILKDNERVLDFFKRIGGLTPEAFEQGATLYREKDGVGYVVLDLDKARKNPQSAFNLILQENDIINVPKLQGLVTINGATRAGEMLPDRIAESGKISVPFEKGKKPATMLIIIPLAFQKVDEND